MFGIYDIKDGYLVDVFVGKGKIGWFFLFVRWGCVWMKWEC